jgi:hypothetical protein
MPGLHILDQQAHLFMVQRRHHTQAVAAAKAGISERSARRIEKDRAGEAGVAVGADAGRCDTHERGDTAGF